jgi:hypothetical protein
VVIVELQNTHTIVHDEEFAIGVFYLIGILRDPAKIPDLTQRAKDTIHLGDANLGVCKNK